MTDLPRGFWAAAAALGIKASGRPDVAIVAIDAELPDAAVAATFTTNTVVAAPVQLSRRHLSLTEPQGDGGYGWARGVLCTSGCANAATGAEGMADQELLARAVAGGLATDFWRVLCLSTGVIGERLPADRLAPEVEDLARTGLGARPNGLAAVAEAMMTTDSRPKLATARLTLPDKDGQPVPVQVSGVAKGVGMIHPRMATMLAIVMTDASAAPPQLHTILRRVVAKTWNQLTVDGDTSTNDTVFLIASGASGAHPSAEDGSWAGDLEAAVAEVARSLARQQAGDGEGATTLITCQVTGAADDADARAIARSVVSSSLVKAAVHGRDPNWGRIASACGNAHLPDAALLEAAGLDQRTARDRAGMPVPFDPAALRIEIAGVPVFSGTVRSFNRASLRTKMDAPELLIAVDLASGHGAGEAFGCDLTERYVTENAEYTS